MEGPENDKSATAGESPAAEPTPAEREGRRRMGRPGAWRLLGSVLGLLAVAGLVLWFVVIPYPRGLEDEDPETTALMEQRRDEARARGDTLEIRRSWVPLDEISRNLTRAVVVAEDYRFREHEGIDWVSLAEEVEWTGDDDFSWWSVSDLRALADAVAYVWSHRSELRGRSTLTQQLAKNLYFGTDRSLVRKAMEAVVARRLERSLSKDRILELYLNIAEWGPGVFGVEAAAETYFGRSASRLNLDQAAALAATLPHPLTSNPARSPARMLWRKELVLDRIDPSRQVPAEPMPLPDPDLDLGLPALGDTELDVQELDTPAADSLVGEDTISSPDTSASPPDTVTPVDTLPPVDTLTPVDTLRPVYTLHPSDVAARPDAVVGRDTVVQPRAESRYDVRESPWTRQSCSRRSA